MWEIQQHICILKEYSLVRPKCRNSTRIIVGFVLVWFWLTFRVYVMV